MVLCTSGPFTGMVSRFDGPKPGIRFPGRFCWPTGLYESLVKSPGRRRVYMTNSILLLRIQTALIRISRQKLGVAKVRFRISNCKLWLDLQQKSNGHPDSSWLFVTRPQPTLASQPPTHLAPPIFLLRLCLWVILGMPPNSMAMFGPDCSSWGIPARSTSMRNYLNSFGNMASNWIQNSNRMASRNLVGFYENFSNAQIIGYHLLDL